MRLNSRTTLVLIAFIAITLSGCSTFKREPNSYYHLSVVGMNEPYEEAIQSATFENDLMRATIRPVRSFDGKRVPLLLKQLLNLQFLMVELTIENNSESLIIYNPAHTAILAGKMDYKKPLDYAGLYYVIRGVKGKGTEEARLRKIKGTFHDLNTRVKPGMTISKYLIFKPLDHDTLTGNAILKINELYIGTKAIALTFPLKVVHTPIEGGQ